MWLGSQVHWLVSGERLERAVSASVDYDVADEVGGDGKRGCCACELSLCWLCVVHDLARDESKCEWEGVVKRGSNLMSEPVPCCFVARAVHKDVRDVVQRCGQTDPACRIRT